MKEKQIKGIWFLDLAKIARKLKDLPWERYLTPEDLKLIQNTILPAQWYPLELYEHLGVAVFELVGQGKPEAAQLFGRFMTDRLLEDEGMRKFLVTGDPIEAAMHFSAFRKRAMTFGDERYEKIADKQVRIAISWPQGQKGMLAFVHDIAGRLSRLIELNGGKNVQITFDQDDLEKKNSINYELQWE